MCRLSGPIDNHVKETKLKDNKRTASGNNINNYVDFYITPEEANDPNAEFLIATYVREHNGGGNDLWLYYDNAVTQVAIKEVVAILSGVKRLNNDGPYPSDRSLNQSLRFDYFGGLKMPLRKVNNHNKVVLEGAIRARNEGSELTDKAFLWVRFELVE